jgi:hypothetical protein
MSFKTVAWTLLTAMACRYSDIELLGFVSASPLAHLGPTPWPRSPARETQKVLRLLVTIQQCLKVAA